MRCAAVPLVAMELACVAMALGCGGTIGSVGAVLARDNQTHALHVREVPPGLAAAEAGLTPGDEILMIDGYYVRELGTKQIQALLRGDVGSEVELTVVHGAEVRQLRIKRSKLREVKPSRSGDEPGR